MDRSSNLKSFLTPAACSFFLSSIAVVVGTRLAWTGGHLWLLPFVLLLPVAVGMSEFRAGYIVFPALYFGTFWAPVIRGSQAFFGDETIGRGFLIWIAAVAICTSIFACAYFLPARMRPFGFTLAVLIHALTPIGIGSPLLVAGALFPATRLMGIALTWLLIRCLACKQYKLCAPLLGLGLLLDILPLPSRTIPGWAAVTTHLPPRPSAFDDWARVQQMLATAAESKDSVLLFPEGLASTWSASSEQAFWLPAFEQLACQRKTVLFGAAVPVSRGDTENMLLCRGAGVGRYQQRIPIPVGMWGRGYHATWGPGIISVAGHRCAVLVCYEQLLPITALRSLVVNPDVLLAPSNMSWVPRGSTIPGTQSLCVRAWARLFDVPYLEAVNE